MDRFVFEKHSENVLTVVPDDEGGVIISVSDEKAVDSYNSTFECDIELDKKQTLLLYQFLATYISAIAVSGRAISASIEYRTYNPKGEPT